MRRTIGLVLLSTLGMEALEGADWKRFRGDLGVSEAPDAAHPVEWGGEANIGWSVPIEGSGWSSPIVVGERLFVSTAISEEGDGPVGFSKGVAMPETRGQPGRPPEQPLSFELQCRSLEDGALLWSRVVAKATPKYPKHPSNTYATESPASDGRHVFVHFAAVGTIAAFTLAGEPLWSQDLGAYPMNAGFGTGASLATAEGLVFVQSDNNEASFLVALDAASGEERWRVDRGRGSGWSTPVVWPREGRHELVACGPDRVTAHAPETGDVLWELSGFGGSFTSSPTFDAERIYFGNSSPGMRGPLIGLRGGAEGELDVLDAEDEELAWVEPRSGPGFSSPARIGDHVYVIGSGGILACHDRNTGERLYRERLDGATTVVACPWVVGDRLFILDETGTTFVVKGGPEFDLVATNRIDDLFWSTPGVAGDALLLRGVDALYCVRRTSVIQEF